MKKSIEEPLAKQAIFWVVASAYHQRVGNVFGAIWCQQVARAYGARLALLRSWHML